MPWVRFTANYDFQPPNARWMIAYKKDCEYLVKKTVAEKAVREGKAVLAPSPKRRIPVHLHAGR